MNLTEKDYLNHLIEQIDFLQNSCERFDKGVVSEGKRIAVGIRTLVHDTKNSVSLLTHLDVKNKLYYFNTAIPETKFGLTGIRTTTEGGGKTIYVAPLDKLSDKRKEQPLITFNKWWTEMKVISDGNNKFSRKDLIMNVANKDGGAHIDSKLNKSYSKLTRENSLNVFHQDNANQLTSVKGVELASIRQIAFELIRTLSRKYPKYFSNLA
ncbi:hypothetical protein [Peribacillus frigoritolerans]|uniref:hypothetical protein n=1 Tax=Peribacillus frigoritolerans TaxID=450367 RepID=UPI0020C0E276|nr:hypothetical protein [Peribacillus frigoritolerans]